MVLTLAVVFADEVDDLVREIQAGTGSHAETANKLMEMARRLNAEPAQQIRLYEEAHRFGLRERMGYGAAVQAAEALLELDRRNRMERWGALLDALRLDLKAAPARERENRGSELVRQLFRAGGERRSAGSLDDALRLYEEARDRAKLYAPSRQVDLSYLLPLLKEEKMLLQRIEGWRQQLNRDPLNTGIREKLIRAYVVELGDLAEAQDFLNQEIHRDLHRLVVLAARSPRELEEAQCLELGDWFKKLSEEATSEGRRRALARAREYYDLFLSLHGGPDLKRLAIEKIQGRLKAELELEEGCELYLPLDRQSIYRIDARSLARDLSGKDTDGQLRGNPKITRGIAGEALALDGKGDCLDLPRGRLESRGAISVSLWVRPGHVRNLYAAIFSKEEAAGYGLSRNPRGYFYFTLRSGGAYHSAAARELARFGEWYHLAGVWNGSSVRLYVNGELQNESPTPGGHRVSGVAASLGSNPGRRRSGYFTGALDEVAVFSRALSPEEVGMLHEIGREGKTLMCPR